MTAPANMESTLVEVDSLLSASGYTRLVDPMRIGNVEIEGVHAFLGPEGSPDLLIVHQLRQPAAIGFAQVERLLGRVARALDAIESRRSMATVLVCEAGSPPFSVDQVTKFGRVLVVLAGADASNALAPILPFRLPAQQYEADTPAPLDDLMPGDATGPDSDALARLKASAKAGPAEVEKLLQKWLDGAFESDAGESNG